MTKNDLKINMMEEQELLSHVEKVLKSAEKKASDVKKLLDK